MVKRGFGLPSRSSPRLCRKLKNARLRQGYGATVFALDLRRERRKNRLACRVEARCVDVTRSTTSASTKVTARQSTFSATAASVDWRQGDYAPASDPIVIQ